MSVKQLDWFDEFAKDKLVHRGQPATVLVHQRHARRHQQRSAGRETASERAREVAQPKARKALSQRERVLECLRRRGQYGATREELAEELGCKEASICARVDELLRPSVGLPLAMQCGGQTRTSSRAGAKPQAIVWAVGFAPQMRHEVND